MSKFIVSANWFRDFYVSLHLICIAINGQTIDFPFLIVAVRPLTIRIQGNNKPLSAGKSVDIVCKTTGSRPSAMVSWWIGSNKLKKTREKHSLDGNVTTSILTMKPTAEDNGKHLSCRAENPSIAESGIEDSWKLSVHCEY